MTRYARLWRESAPKVSVEKKTVKDLKPKPGKADHVKGGFGGFRS